MASILELAVLDIPGHIINACNNTFSASANKSEQTARFEFSKLTLCIEISGNILEAVVFDNHYNVPRKILDALRWRVRFIISAANAGKVPKNIEALDFVAREALEVIYDFESQGTSQETKAWRADEEFDVNALINNLYGLDTSTITDTAFHFLGKTPQELCEAIPIAWRVIHIESIMRKDLAKRFRTYRGALETMLRNKRDIDGLRASIPPFSKVAEGQMLSSLKKDDVIRDMVTPRVTYHGTTLQNVGSIIRHGFKLPGSRLDDGVVVSPRSGIAWNRGIYSSQAPFYALSYAPYEKRATPLGKLPTMRLFVCATIMGQTLTGNAKERRSELIHGPRVEGYDSHFDGGYELIVHNDAAILPCYVIHLDLGAEVAKQAILEAQEDPVDFEQMNQKQTKLHPKLVQLAPGDAARIAAEKKAAARKHFPMGFGPAGKNFVIEEIAPTDDDEEEHGAWQDTRHGYYDEYLNQSLDQYQAERRS